MDSYAKHIRWIEAETFQDAGKKPVESIVICCGTVKNQKVITTKKGEKMAFALIEDYTSKAEIVVFPNCLLKSNSGSQPIPSLSSKE